jgi:hypothetical protein
MSTDRYLEIEVRESIGNIIFGLRRPSKPISRLRHQIDADRKPSVTPQRIRIREPNCVKH